MARAHRYYIPGHIYQAERLENTLIIGKTDRPKLN